MLQKIFLKGRKQMKKCSKCKADILDEAKICPNCGCPVETETTLNNTALQTENSPQSSAPNNEIYAYQNTNVQAFASPRIKKKVNIKSIISVIIDVIGVLTGIITTILGLNFKDSSLFFYADLETYGGDAYTGMQNASAQAANNIAQLGYSFEKAVSIIIAVLGIFIILYFIGKIIKEIKINK